jgi:hypothetical protein
MAGVINWKDIVEQVQVELSYKDQENDVPEISYVAQLTSQAPSDKFDATILAPQEQPVRWRSTFFLKNNEQVTIDGDPTSSNRLIINQPEDLPVLRASIQAAGNLDLVRRIIIDLQADDPELEDAGRTSLVIDKDSDSAVWDVLLLDPARTTFRYRYMILPTDPDEPVIHGPGQEGEWSAPQENGRTVVIDWLSPPLLKVTVRGTRLEFADDGLIATEVSLRTEHALDNNKSIFTTDFDSSNAKESKPLWSVILKRDTPEARTYRWEVRYIYGDTEKVVTGTDDKPTFWVPRPEA